MNRLFGLALAAAVPLAASTGAFACGTGKAVYTDGFDVLTKDWGDANDQKKVKDGMLTISQEDGDFYSVYIPPTYRQVDACAKVKLMDTSDDTGSYAGIMFWVRDIDHFYVFEISGDGYAGVFQYEEKWSTLIDDAEFDAIKTAKGAINEMRVVTRNGTASFYVNDVKFDELTLKTAPGSQHIGLMMEAPVGGSATFGFDSLEIREVSAK